MIKLVVAGVLLAVMGASPAAEPTTCTVSGATITWGFKESFRSYISGSIAHGKWTVANGATYATPDFGFSDGSGTLDAGRGTLAFPGSIEFTGHGGILDTTVANPRLRFDGTTATLVLDVSGTTQQGKPVDAAAVDFATIDLSGADRSAAFALDAAPTTLTSAGADAFGTYPAGTALDPITVAFSAPASCTTPQPQPIALSIAIGASATALVAAGAIVAVRRRRARDLRPSKD